MPHPNRDIADAAPPAARHVAPDATRPRLLASLFGSNVMPCDCGALLFLDTDGMGRVVRLDYETRGPHTCVP